MTHARQQKQTVEVLDVSARLDGCRSSDCRYDAVEVVDAVVRRDAPVGPAVILDELAAAIPKRPEIGVVRVQQLADMLVRVRDVALQIHRGVVPGWILENEIPIQGLGPGDLPDVPEVAPGHQVPIELTAMREAGKYLRSIPAPDVGVQFLDGLNL